MFDGEPLSPETLDACERFVDSWLAQEADSAAVIDAVERGTDDQRRWYVRIRGEEKDVWTIWLTLGQRTLSFETYLTPAPEENHARFYEHLLRRNHKLQGLKLEIGVEDAVFLAGAMPADQVTAEALDWMLGAMYEAVELIFVPAMRIGYASRFRR